MWDPAHGKPYASAQLALSFGVGGLGPVSAQPLYKWSLRDLNCILIALLLSHQRRRMLLPQLGFRRGTRRRRTRWTDAEVKGHQDLPSPT